MHGGFSISKSVFFISITLDQCSAAKPYLSSVQRIGKRTIGAMKLHQHFEFGPASQDPFSFCQIQLALNTVWGNVKGGIQGTGRRFQHWGMQKASFQGPEEFRRLFWQGRGKKATSRTSCCNIHNATTPATEEPTTAETLSRAWVPARA